MSAALAGLATAAVARFVSLQMRQQTGHAFRLEQQQALRASLDTITRDLRLAGACLPTNGDYVALDGTDGPGPDTVTVRAGIVRGDLSCLVTTVNALAGGGTHVLPVESSAGFLPNMRVYVRHPGGAGQYTAVTSKTATTITLYDATTMDYPVGSGLYAVDERTYAIDATGPAPRLMLTVDQGPPQAFAAGVSDLQARYVLERNCPPCDTVDLPPDDATWRLVNQVLVTARVDTVGAARVEDQVSITQTSRAKPRNLLP